MYRDTFVTTEHHYNLTLKLNGVQSIKENLLFFYPAFSQMSCPTRTFSPPQTQHSQRMKPRKTCFPFVFRLDSVYLSPYAFRPAALSHLRPLHPGFQNAPQV